MAPKLGARETDLAKTASEDALAENEGRPTGRAGLLGVVVGEAHAFTCDAVDVRGAVSHQAVRVGADVGVADVITPDHQDVRLVVLRPYRRSHRRCRKNGNQR